MLQKVMLQHILNKYYKNWLQIIIKHLNLMISYIEVYNNINCYSMLISNMEQAPS